MRRRHVHGVWMVCCSLLLLVVEGQERFAPGSSYKSFDDKVRNMPVEQIRKLQIDAFRAACNPKNIDGVETIAKHSYETDSFTLRVIHPFSGNTIAHCAALTGNTRLLNILVKYGQRDLLTTSNVLGDTPTHIAASTGDETILRELVHLSGTKVLAQPNSDDGDSPMHVAAVFGYVNVLKYAHSLGLTEALNPRNNLGTTPAHYAAKAGQVGFLKELAALVGPKVLTAENSEHVVPAHFAAQEGNLNVLEFLHAAGAAQSLIHQDRIGNLPVHYAALKGQAHVVPILHSVGGAKSLGESNIARNTPAHLAFAKKHQAFIKALVDLGAKESFYKTNLIVRPAMDERVHEEALKVDSEKNPPVPSKAAPAEASNLRAASNDVPAPVSLPTEAESGLNSETPQIWSPQVSLLLVALLAIIFAHMTSSHKPSLRASGDDVKLVAEEIKSKGAGKKEKRRKGRRHVQDEVLSASSSFSNEDGVSQVQSDSEDANSSTSTVEGVDTISTSSFNHREEELNECLVCMEGVRNWCLIPCGHVVLCNKCADYEKFFDKQSRPFSACPLCRADLRVPFFMHKDDAGMKVYA